MNIRKKILIAFLTFTLSFFILDVLLFKLFPVNCQLYEQSEVLNHVLIPNSQCPGKTEEFNVTYSVNEFGLRDVNFDQKKAENTFRILFLGDSFTFGTGVNLKDTYVKQFEKSIDKDQKYHVEAINAGVPAYGLLLEDLYLRSNGLTFEPDVVIVALSMTDFFDERRLLKISRKDEFGKVIGVAGPKTRIYLPDKPHYFLKNQSFIYNLFLKKQEELWKLKGRITAVILGRETPEYAVVDQAFTPGDPDTDTFAITREISDERFEELLLPVAKRLNSMSRILAEQKIPMLIVVIPSAHQISENEWSEGRKVLKLEKESYPDKILLEIKKFTENSHISAIDPTSALRKESELNPEEKLYISYDGHLTPKGHKIVANEIVSYLLSNRESNNLF